MHSSNSSLSGKILPRGTNPPIILFSARGEQGVELCSDLFHAIRPISRECAKPCDSRAWRFSSRRKRACWLKSRACSYLERAAAVAVRWPVGRAWGLGVVSRRRSASHTRTHTVCVEKRKKKQLMDKRVQVTKQDSQKFSQSWNVSIMTNGGGEGIQKEKKNLSF